MAPENNQAIVTMIKEYGPALRRYIQRRTGTVDVDDHLQEVFSRMSTRQNISYISYPKSYLFRIARNLVADERRSKVRTPVLVDSDQAFAAAERPADRDVNFDPRLTFDLIDGQIDLNLLCEGLPESHLDLVRLRAHGASNEEIATSKSVSIYKIRRLWEEAFAHMRMRGGACKKERKR